MADKLLPPSKRAREEGGCKIVEDESLQKVLSFDTDDIASTGLHDALMFQKLQDFSSRLQTSLVAVKKIRDEQEQAIRDEKTKQLLDQQTKIREEKTKLRMQLVAEKRCFKCNVVHDGKLNQCVEYKHGGGVSGDGVLVCDKCLDEVTTHSCASCNSFFHDDRENFCCNCTDDSYTCKSCEEVFCIACAEEDEDKGRSCGGCGDWYCNGCDDDNIETKCCRMCDKGEESCGGTLCTSGDMGECENCNEPLCDGCVCRLACGNDVRLCGECDFDCEDCDMCAGYYQQSRWA